MKLAIYYHRYLVSTGKPICLSNGHSEIHTNKIIFENLSGQVVYNSTKGRGLHLYQARRHGTTTPMEIEILPAPEDETELQLERADLDQRTKMRILLESGLVPPDTRKLKAIKERNRYRLLHPEIKGHRKSLTE